MMETFDGAARKIAAKVVDGDHRNFLLSCKPASSAAADDACASQILTHYGRLLLRRPLSQGELSKLVAISRDGASTTNDFYSGVATSLATVMVMPEFIFFMDATEADPAHPGKLRLTGASKASRLSLFLWDEAPDEELLSAAERGELHTSAGLQRQVERMLADRRFTTGVRAFFSDMLMFESFDALAKDPIIYPAFTQTVVGAAREQIVKTITSLLIEEKGDYRDLFTTHRTFLNGDLSPLYRVPTDEPKQWRAYDDGDAQSARAGLLTEIGFLAVYAHPGTSSATRRGRAVREVLLCQKVPDPPPNVDFTGFQDPKSVAVTARQRLAAHSTNPVCAGCHKLTDPIGLALENFDGAGQYRTAEKGVPIDASGSLNGVSYKDAVGLGKALSKDPQLTHCLVKRMTAYGVGYASADKAWLEELHTSFADHGYQVPELIKGIVLSDGFFAVSAKNEATKTAMASGQLPSPK